MDFAGNILRVHLFAILYKNGKSSNKSTSQSYKLIQGAAASTSSPEQAILLARAPVVSKGTDLNQNNSKVCLSTSYSLHKN